MPGIGRVDVEGDQLLAGEAGHRFSLTWASYSSRKYLRVERNGLGELLPKAQRAASMRSRELLEELDVPSLPLLL